MDENNVIALETPGAEERDALPDVLRQEEPGAYWLRRLRRKWRRSWPPMSTSRTREAAVL